MRRPSLNSLPPRWRKGILLAAIFVMGALFDNYLLDSYVFPFLSRDVWVWTIKGVKERGCTGDSGATLIRFGRGIGQSD
jgi:hypothetical protein